MAQLSSVYIDACCFIDIVKTDVGEQVEAGRDNEVWYLKKILQAHRDKEIQAYTSVLTIAESTHVGSVPVPSDVQVRFERLLTSGQYVQLIQVTPFVCSDVRDLRWNHGINLKGADGIHIASAIERGCSEFLSFNGRFERASRHTSFLEGKGLRVRLPSQTDALPAKYLQTDMLDNGDTH